MGKKKYKYVINSLSKIKLVITPTSILKKFMHNLFLVFAFLLFAENTRTEIKVP